MESNSRLISEVDVAAARKQAVRELSRQDLSRVPQDVQEALLNVASGYIAAHRNGLSTKNSLEASLGVFWNHRASAQEVSSLDGLVSEVARTPERSREVLGGALSHLSSHGPGFHVRLGSKWYRRRKADRPHIIGLDSQQEELSLSVNHLFAYRPETGTNPARDALQQAVMLYGPPGTGKSSLCKYAVAEAKDASAVTGIPFRHEIFKAADYSKWVGESSQALRKKFLSISDPSGIGILILDDVDMVLASRDDNSASHGGLQVTSEAMQFLSGVEHEYTGNYLVLATTNRLESIDSAMLRRFKEFLLVPGYTRRKEYQRFFDARLSWADSAVRSVAADRGFENNYSPADLDKMCVQLERRRLGRLTPEQLKDPLAHAKELSASAVDALLTDYCSRYNELK